LIYEDSVKITLNIIRYINDRFFEYKCEYNFKNKIEVLGI